MATVSSPLHSEAAIGSLGDVTFSRHKGTNVARRRPMPTNPQTLRQLAVRAQHTTTARAWAGLDQAERNAWDAWAADHSRTDAFGNVQQSTGFSWFCGLTDRLLDMTLTQVDTPPAVAGPASPAAVVATGGNDQISIAFTPAAATTKLDVWLYGPHSTGRKPKLAQATHNAYSAGETSPKVIANLTAGYFTLWVRIISETDGQASPFVKVTATVT